MDATGIVMPAAQAKKRFGLIAARIGKSFAHKISVALPLEPPQYSTVTKAPGQQARTSARKRVPNIEFGTQPGHAVPVPVRAVPGATVYLDVQDISLLTDEERAQVRYVCQHPECQGKRWTSKTEIKHAHGDNVKLAKDSEADPAGRPHLYYGVLEIAGTSEKKNDKGQVTAPATEPTVMLVSDEE